MCAVGARRPVARPSQTAPLPPPNPPPPRYARFLLQLRVQKVTQNAANKLAQIKVVRKAIARVLTVYNQNEKVRPGGREGGGKSCSVLSSSRRSTAAVPPRGVGAAVWATSLPAMPCSSVVVPFSRC
jgi:hypothetical protein